MNTVYSRSAMPFRQMGTNAIVLQSYFTAVSVPKVAIAKFVSRTLLDSTVISHIIKR